MRWLLPLALCACDSGDLLDRVNALENEEVRLLEERETMVAEIARLERRVKRYRELRAEVPRRISERPNIDGVEAVDDTHYTVSRAGLRTLLANEDLIRTARVVPNFEDGEPRGYKLYGIRRSTAPDTLGFKNGDTVYTVNDSDIDASGASEWAAGLLEAERIVIEGSRRGAPLTLTWELTE